MFAITCLDYLRLYYQCYFFTKKIEYASEYFVTSPRITGLPFFQYLAT